jgi:hypothetical protein
LPLPAFLLPERMMGGAGRRPRRTPWGVAVRERFLAALRETGNVSASARAAGASPQLFYGRREREPEFAAAWNAALTESAAVLKAAETPFEAGRWRAEPVIPSGSAKGRKPAPAEGEKVIRRTSNGRMQIAAARPGQWTASTDKAFFALLRQTGNLSATARAVGFDVSSVWERYRKWPAFAREWERTLEEASLELEFRLLCLGNNVLAGEGGGTSGTEEAGSEAAKFDPEFALKFLKWREEKRQGRGRRRHGPREPSIEEVRKSILSKIEAIERQRKLKEGDAG